MITRLFFVLLFSVAFTPAYASSTMEEAPDCTTVSQCISILSEHHIKPPPQPGDRLSSGIKDEPIENAVRRLVLFGDDAVIALIKLFDHPNYYVRNRAGYTLFHFPQIDPRHLPDLIIAHKHGISWLEPAIAATGTDEALAFLWENFLANPSQGSNSQTFRVLPEFGDRLYPYFKEELEGCQTSDQLDLCWALLTLLGGIDPWPDFVVPTLEGIATSLDASDRVRKIATDQLIALKHPYGLVVLRGDLKKALRTLSDHPSNRLFYKFSDTDDFSEYYDIWDIGDAIRSTGNYGDKAKELGPLITPFLARRDLGDVRALAALTLGQIDYQGGINSLVAIRSDFDDDWNLAYNAVESLGRLHAESARGVVEALAHNHWFKPVRNNAERALSLLDGGEFTRPNNTSDSAPLSDDDQWRMWRAGLRHTSDLLEISKACNASRTETYNLYMPRRVTWPEGNNVRLELSFPGADETQHIFSTYPKLREQRGELKFAVKFGNHLIAGLDAGEFGGEVHTIDQHGHVELLIPDNAIAAFKTRKRLYIVTGLSHMSMSTGNLWVVELDQRKPVLQRRIRLLREPNGYEFTFQKALVIKSETGDFAIQSNGKLIDASEIDNCINVSRNN
ncbi:MAG: hypothetical protein DHS20C05_16880 [Hyphococcus sp.]|nr:MAG: hypothetical protein DHS20C05_16880 [Marinicaulis sp.]